jgi:hypothetical protein
VDKLSHPPKPVLRSLQHTLCTFLTRVKTQPLFPIECRTRVSLKTAIPRTPPVHPQPPSTHIQTALLQAHPGTECSQYRSLICKKAIRCLPQSKCIRRKGFTRTLHPSLTLPLNLLIHLALAKKKKKKMHWRANDLGARNPERQCERRGANLKGH